jgi:hypothetical protein
MESPILIDRLYSLAWVAKQWRRPEFNEDITFSNFTIANTILDLAREKPWFSHLSEHYSTTYLIGKQLSNGLFDYAEMTYSQNQKDPVQSRRQMKIKYHPIIDFLYSLLVSTQNLHFATTAPEGQQKLLLVTDVQGADYADFYDIPVVVEKGIRLVERELIKSNQLVDIVNIHGISSPEMNELRKSFYRSL